MRSVISVTKNLKNTEMTIFEYAYIDGSNYKSFGQIHLSGGVSSDQNILVAAKLESGQFFVAEQLGIPPLYDGLFKYSNGSTPDDHGWHVFIGLRNKMNHEVLVDLPAWGSVDQLLAKFRNVKEWEPSLSVNFTVCRAA